MYTLRRAIPIGDHKTTVHMQIILQYRQLLYFSLCNGIMFYNYWLIPQYLCLLWETILGGCNFGIECQGVCQGACESCLSHCTSTRGCRVLCHNWLWVIDAILPWYSRECMMGLHDTIKGLYCDTHPLIVYWGCCSVPEMWYAGVSVGCYPFSLNHGHDEATRWVHLSWRFWGFGRRGSHASSSRLARAQSLPRRSSGGCTAFQHQPAWVRFVIGTWTRCIHLHMDAGLSSTIWCFT